MNIVETVNVAREVAWLPWAVQYFFLIGLSYGAFFVSLPGIAFRVGSWERISRLALLGALICGLTAPVALLADLHQPGRFWHFYAYFQPASWMSWGAFFIPVYVTGLLLYAWLAFRPLLARHAAEGGRLAPVARLLAYGGLESRGALLAAAALAFIGAVLVAVYTGAEVMAVRARPLWHTPLVPLQFFVTALAGGLGLTLLLNRYAPAFDREAATARLAKGIALTQIAALAVGAVWFGLGITGASAEHARALAEIAPSGDWQWSGVILVGLAVATLWLALRDPGSGLVLGALAVASAWMMRWTLFIGGQEVPKTGAGFYDYQLPAGPDGLLGIVGTVGLWIFLYVAITSLLPLERLGRPDRAAA